MRCGRESHHDFRSPRIAHIRHDARRRSSRVNSIATRATRDVRNLVEAFERAAQRVRRQRSGRVAGDPITDPEAVHDLRVATRRLTSALNLWRPALHKSERRAAAQALRRIRRAFGSVREVEVHIGHLRSRDTEAHGTRRPAIAGLASAISPAERAAFGALERSLRTRYARLRANALATIAPRRVRDVSRDVARAFDGTPHRIADPRTRKKVDERMRAARAQALESMRTACRPGLHADDEAFHRARIAIKKWRYAAERKAQATGRADAPTERLRELQRALGDGHDAITLDRAITGFAARSKAHRVTLAAVSKALRRAVGLHVTRFLDRAAKFEASEERIRRGRARDSAAAARTSRPQRAPAKTGTPRRPVSSRKPSSRRAGSSRGSSPGT